MRSVQSRCKERGSPFRCCGAIGVLLAFQRRDDHPDIEDDRQTRVEADIDSQRLSRLVVVKFSLAAFVGVVLIPQGRPQSDPDV